MTGSTEPAAGELLASGLSALVAGRVRDARSLLEDAARAASDAPTLAAAAALGGAVAGLMSGDARGAIEAEAAVAAAEAAVV